MAKLVVTNVTNSPVRLSDLYTNLLPGATLEKEVSLGAILGMSGLAQVISEGSVTVAIETTAGEDALVALLTSKQG